MKQQEEEGEEERRGESGEVRKNREMFVPSLGSSSGLGLSCWLLAGTVMFASR